MFYLTSYIIITLQDGRRLRVRPYSVKWKRSVENLCDTCEITLPLHPYLYTTKPNQSSRECLIRVDDPVSVSLGYNDNNTVRFIGFVAAVNYSERLVLQCEGYYHLIKQKTKSDSWKSVSLKKLLEELTFGTDITLSKSIPDEQLGTVSLQNASMDKVFEMLKNNYQCVAYFKGKELYVGAALAPVTAQAVSQFATLAANPQGGLESASRMLLETQWIDGDDCLRNDDDYFITVMLQVQQLIELKKSNVLKL